MLRGWAGSIPVPSSTRKPQNSENSPTTGRPILRPKALKTKDVRRQISQGKTCAVKGVGPSVVVWCQSREIKANLLSVDGS